MDIQQLQKTAREKFELAMISETCDVNNEHSLKSIAASLLAITEYQEDLLKELQAIKAAVSSLAAQGE